MAYCKKRQVLWFRPCLFNLIVGTGSHCRIVMFVCGCSIMLYVDLDFVTWSRGKSHLSTISISIFLHHFLKTYKIFISIQTPLQLDIWLQSYEGFGNARNIMKQRNLNTVFLPISQKQHPRHRTHSSWSCHILCFSYDFSKTLTV